MILAGDVGGTKCNLALFSEEGGTLTPVFKQRFASKEFAQFERIVKEFSRQAAEHLGKAPIAAAGFGIAGPVINGCVRATNLPWIVDTEALIKVLNVPHVVLLNDLGATGHSIEHLPPEDFCVLNPGNPEPGGTRALLAAGTGLGQSILVWDGGRYRVVPSEGGHSDFAPHTEQQIELLRFMRRRYPQVSWELILSGRGFRTIHEFLAPKVTHASFEDPDADPAPEITRRGLDKSCRVCSDTLDLWTARRCLRRRRHCRQNPRKNERRHFLPRLQGQMEIRRPPQQHPRLHRPQRIRPAPRSRLRSPRRHRQVGQAWRLPRLLSGRRAVLPPAPHAPYRPLLVAPASLLAVCPVSTPRQKHRPSALVLD